MYGTENVQFTLDDFSNIVKDEQRLRVYREALSKIKYRLDDEAKKTQQRGFVPTTFDSMMLDFGNRIQRKQLNEKFEQGAD